MRGLDRLDDGVREVTNARFGQDATRQPFPMVPRNAALRVQFDRDLGVATEFFPRRHAWVGETPLLLESYGVVYRLETR